MRPVRPRSLALATLFVCAVGCQRSAPSGQGHDHDHGHDHAHEHGHTHEHAHAHGSPHGGTVQSAPGGHVEVKLERDGTVRVWFLDVNEATVSAQGATGSVRLAAAGSQDVALAYDAAQNALTGRVPSPGDTPVLLVEVARAGGERATLRHTANFAAAGN